MTSLASSDNNDDTNEVHCNTTTTAALVTPQKQTISSANTPTSLRHLGLTPETSVIPSPRNPHKPTKRKKTTFIAGLIPPNMKNLTPMKEILKMHYTDRFVALAQYGWKFMDGKWIKPLTKIKFDKNDKTRKTYEIMGKDGVDYFTKSKDMLKYLRKCVRESALLKKKRKHVVDSKKHVKKRKILNTPSPTHNSK